MRGLKRTTRVCAVLLALLSACALKASGQEGAAADVQRLFVPGTRRAIDLDLRGFRTPLVEWEAEQIANNDGRVREFTAALEPPRDGRGEPRPLNFTAALLRIRVEPERAAGGAAALRDAALERRMKMKGFDKDTFRQSVYKQTPLLRYKVLGPSASEGTFPTYLPGYSTAPVGPGLYPGPKVSSSALEAYLAQDGVWVTLTYFGTKLKDEDEKVFYALLDSAKFVDASNPSTSFDYYALGCELYKGKEYAPAAGALEKALALEQRSRGLTHAQWVDMVRTLSDAAGSAGDVQRARDVLLYGLGVEPDNGYFHHALARVYAYLGDLDNALASLRLSYVNLPPELKFFKTWLPDPSDDSAFKRFKDDPKFREALKEMKKQVRK
jgi:tetratricopeptide (TPR) repeat protein